MSSALDQIIKWSHGLPAWQSDAVRRYLEQGELTPTDRDDLYQMLMVHAGIKGECVSPQPAILGSISGAPIGWQELTLERILNVQHVNAVKNGSTIPFGLKGITVVYGQNGSGKSSYARILKRACRARDIKEPIHPNIFDAQEAGPATATVKITEGTTKNIELQWTDGVPSDERLTRITFFDSKCARVIVDESNDAVYIPYGCQVFDSLVDLLKGFRGRLQSARPTPKEVSLTGVVEGTASHGFLVQLSRMTTTESIDNATAWSETDETSLSTVITRITQSKTKESMEKARRLRSTADRIQIMLDALLLYAKSLESAGAAELNALLDDLDAAEKAAGIAAATNLKCEKLPSGTSNEWKMLYEAARDYSLKIAYPGEDFAAANSRCVLCQRPLDEEATLRFARFAAFMQDTTELKLKKMRARIATHRQSVQALPSLDPGAYKDVIAEILDAEKASVLACLADLSTSKDAFLSAIDNKKKPPETPSPEGAQKVLAALKTSLQSQAQQLDKDADPETLKQLLTNRDELASRKAVHQRRDEIVSFVKDCQLDYKFEQCNNSLTTRSISDRSKEIIGSALSPQLTSDLKKELKRLGASHLPLSFNITGKDGGARHQLTLENPVRRAKLSEILSEGEQCVVAVAGFLAEVSGAPSKSPIVFDDPVSSLDHRYCRYIAERLAEEAKERQVIVFTHNIAFLVEIEKRSAGANLLVQTVQRSGSVAGFCIEGLPWEAMSVKDRLVYVDGLLGKAQLQFSVDDTLYNREAAYIYDLLRQSWEAFIEKELLYQTVQRHDTDVQTMRLMQVEVLDSDCATIHQSMSKCSTWMAGHDKSVALDVNRPAPAEIKDDIAVLRAFTKEMNKRREVVRLRRKEVLEPKTPQVG